MFEGKTDAEKYEAMRAACEAEIDRQMALAENASALGVLERARVGGVRRVTAHGVLVGFRIMVAAAFPPGAFPLDRDATALEARIVGALVNCW
jgi:hypothetical protein